MCQVLSYNHFPKDYFPSDNFPSGSFPIPIVQISKQHLQKVRLGLLRRRRLQWGGPSAATRMGFGEGALLLEQVRDRVLRLGQTWEVAD